MKISSGYNFTRLISSCNKTAKGKFLWSSNWKSVLDLSELRCDKLQCFFIHPTFEYNLIDFFHNCEHWDSIFFENDFQLIESICNIVDSQNFNIRLDFCWTWISGECVNILSSYGPHFIFKKGKRLQKIDNTTHISLTQFKHSLNCWVIDQNILLLTNVFYSLCCRFERNLFEFESRTSRLQSWDNFRDVVGDETETSILSILLNDYIITLVLLLKANWEADVIISASSRIINFKLLFLFYGRWT